IPETPERQKTYVTFLLSECTRLRAVFINWFMVRDYDDLWSSELQFLPEAPLIRVWRDIGLYDGAGQPRPALDPWRSTLAARPPAPRPRGAAWGRPPAADARLRQNLLDTLSRGQDRDDRPAAGPLEEQRHRADRGERARDRPRA